MKLVDRYLLLELASTCAGATGLLLLTTVGGTLSDVLRRVATGEVPTSLVAAQVGLRSLEALSLLLPLALFLSVLLAYGRLYRDGEMTILASAGMGHRALLRPVLYFSVPLVACIAALTFLVVPQALRVADRMVDEANRSLLAAGLEAGRFMPLPGGAGMVYVGEIDAGGSRFRRMFVFRERGDRVDIVTASEGRLFQDQNGVDRFLSLQDGFRVEGSLESPDFRTMRFERNDLRLPQPEKIRRNRSESRHSSLELLRSRARGARAELHWRLALPLSALTLALLAFPLSRSDPRASRYARLAVGVLTYLVYLNLLTLGRGWIADGSLPGSLGLWWVHALALAIAAWMIAAAWKLTLPGFPGVRRT